MISLATNDPKQTKSNSGTERGTREAVKAASSTPTPEVRTEDFPTNGEQGGKFYFEKVISGIGEVPEQVHADNAHEVIRMAEAAGWLATGDVFPAEQRSLGDRWQIFYAVPVHPNGEGNQATSTEDQKNGA